MGAALLLQDVSKQLASFKSSFVHFLISFSCLFGRKPKMESLQNLVSNFLFTLSVKMGENIYIIANCKCSCCNMHYTVFFSSCI